MVSRIGVGYDAVDVPALTRRKIPLIIGGTANSVSVAEARGLFDHVVGPPPRRGDERTG